MSAEEYLKVAEYFVVAGLTDTSKPLEEDLAFPNAHHKLSEQRKDPITDIFVIDKTLEESCPQGYTCIEHTPTGLHADLNHGSLTAHNMLLCYRRGKDKPPLIDLGVYYEGLETVKSGIQILETTPAGRSANVNNKSGMGSHPIYLTYRRAKESAPQNSLVVTDICIILTNKGETAPYAFCQIEKNLNKGLIGSSVYLCYKKSMRQVDSLPFKAGLIGRYPREDVGSFPLPFSVPLFCLPMGATIECWSNKMRHPLPTFSSFVLTTETSEKIFGAVVSFYESYPEEQLTDEQRYKLGLLRGDGQRSKSAKTVHTNKAICLLSRWPMFDAFRDFLMYLYRLTVSPIAHAVPVERHIAHFMQNVPFPTSQRPRVQYQMSPMHTTILMRPQITPIPLSGASFLALLDDLGPENTINLIVLALTEHKIVIHSLRPAEITCVAEALITLLFPFKWQCTYVPLCPLEMGYVLEAPTPFIVGVDSRYFDLYEPPRDVACVNLDTSNITHFEEKKMNWKVLPRKHSKQLRSTLVRYFKEVKECPRDDVTVGPGTMLDPDLTRTERHRQLDLAVQEAFLKLMCSLMKGYRQFLLPITEAPNVGTADTSSLFNIQEFNRSRDRASQRFFAALTSTQLFSSFVEERSLASFAGGEDDVTSGRSSSLVFFDECIDRLAPEHAMENVKLIEADDSLKSEHTVMIMPPDEVGLPAGVGYQYTTFPELQDELFSLGEDDADLDQRNDSLRPRRKSDTFMFGSRTKQEIRTLHKISANHNRDPHLWAKLLLSHTYGAWFACLPAFVQGCRHKSAALRTAHDALYSLRDKDCFPLPDETYYRMLLHLCAIYNKPALAVRVFQFVRKTGTQLSAITYGLYNKAVLEGTWPASNRDGYMLWQKLRTVFLATQKFRYLLRRPSSVVIGSEEGSDFDTSSHTSVDSSSQSTPQEKMSPEKQLPEVTAEPDAVGVVEKKLRLSVVDQTEGECKSTGGQSDHGYNSMPKDLIRRGSPNKAAKAVSTYSDSSLPEKAASTAKDSLHEEKSINTVTTDSLMSLSDAGDSAHPVTVQRTLSGRNVQPPSTLDIPSIHDNAQAANNPGLPSDETLVNSDAFTALEGGDARKDALPHRPRSSPVSPSRHRKPGRTCSIVKSPSSGGSTSGGGLPEESGSDLGSGCPVDSTISSDLTVASASFRVHAAHATNNDEPLAHTNARCSDLASGSRGLFRSFAERKSLKSGSKLPILEISKCDETHPGTETAPGNCYSLSRKGLSPSILLSPSMTTIDNVFDEKASSGNVDNGSTLLEINAGTKPPEVNQACLQCNKLDLANSSGSPVTPEIASVFSGDSKFVSSLSDSDQKRYQELCSHRSTSLDAERLDAGKTRHGSLLFSRHPRGRSSTALYASGGISPLIGQKSFSEFTANNSSTTFSPTHRANFDNLTAEDIAMSPTSSPKHLGLRSPSGSILSRNNYPSPSRSFPSPNRSRGSSDSPKHRRRSVQNKFAGSNSLVVVDGVPMLSSTPLRTLPEPDAHPLADGAHKDSSNFAAENSPSKSDSMKRKSKQTVAREDISHLAEDPLSPSSTAPIKSEVKTDNDVDPLTNRHLVDEIKDHLKRDSLVRCVSDATTHVKQKERLDKESIVTSNEENGNALQRKTSLPSSSPKLPRKNSSHSLPRSSTLDNTSSSSSWFGSGSKLNSLLKSTTMGMASKAKKVATNLAKDLNETMQASIAYYTPEKIKGSLTDLNFGSSQEDILGNASNGPSNKKQLLGVKGTNLYSSQTSLKSSESIHSALDTKSASEKVQRRTTGGRKHPRKLDRPMSMPHFDSAGVKPPLPSSYLSVPGENTTSPDLNITSSMLSLYSKGNCDVEVVMSSCSKCHKCESLVYDEEIMAGWMADESNLNTHCPFCDSLFVPFLNIEIKDYRSANQKSSSLSQLQPMSPASTNSERSSKATGESRTTVLPEQATVASSKFAATCLLPMSPEPAQQSDSEIMNEGAQEQPADEQNSAATPTENTSLPTTPVTSPTPHERDVKEEPDEEEAITPQNDPSGPTFDSAPQLKQTATDPLAVQEDFKSSVSSLSENPPSEAPSSSTAILPDTLDPVTVPYLSSLVLRKELESLLENEGTTVLTEPDFVDHHPIIYWNLVWYFRRLNLHSNLYDLLLQSQLLKCNFSQPKTSKGVVSFHLMWDNIKLHGDGEKPPLYCMWYQMVTQPSNTEYQHYSVAFLESIRDSIMHDDVRSPLVAVLNELNAQNGVRRSAYREILYMVIIALGKDSIDLAAFDREYQRAYDALQPAERALAKRCDRTPNNHAMDCRNIFGELDLK